MKSKLESEGVPCVILGKDHSESLTYSLTSEGIQLQIKPADIDKATKVFEEYHISKLKDAAGRIIKCPKCQSDFVYTGFKSSENKKGISSAILSFSMNMFPFFHRTIYKCRSCGHEFKN